jgi:RNA polymerase sigma-70 factor (ECF subfamily)
VAGDSKAFAVLVDRYKDLVFTLALRMLKNREEARGSVGHTFKSIQSLVKFKGILNFPLGFIE